MIDLSKSRVTKGTMKATDQLIEEHQKVEEMIAILEAISKRLENGENVDPEHLKKLAEFISVFVEKCHHKKEEGYLFPAMLGSDIPDSQLVHDLIKDHLGFYKLIGEIVHTFSDYNPENPKSNLLVIEAIKRYTPLLKEHAEKEEEIAFPMADKYLSPDMQDQLLQDFEKFEQNQIGVGKYEEFYKMLDKLKQIYLA